MHFFTGWVIEVALKELCVIFRAHYTCCDTLSRAQILRLLSSSLRSLFTTGFISGVVVRFWMSSDSQRVSLFSDVLRYLSLDPNDRRGHQARELKSIYMDSSAAAIRLLLHNCYTNKLNVYNQVRYISLSISSFSVLPFVSSENFQQTQLLIYSHIYIFKRLAWKQRRSLHADGLFLIWSNVLANLIIWHLLNLRALRILQVGLMAVIITGDPLEGQQMESFNRHDVTTPSHVSMYRLSSSICSSLCFSRNSILQIWRFSRF